MRAFLENLGFLRCLLVRIFFLHASVERSMRPHGQGGVLISSPPGKD